MQNFICLQLQDLLRCIQDQFANTERERAVVDCLNLEEQAAQSGEPLRHQIETAILENGGKQEKRGKI